VASRVAGRGEHGFPGYEFGEVTRQAQYNLVVVRHRSLPSVLAPPRPRPAPTVPAQTGPRPSEAGGEAPDPNAISEPQRRKVFARVREILPAGAPDDEIRANCTAVAQQMFKSTVSGLTKKQASSMIEWLETATMEMLTDDIPF
jgi:hypothetical protein